MFLELLARKNYARLDHGLSYWRTQTHLEVDFLIEDQIAIKVKGTSNVSDADLKPLRALKDDLPVKRRIVVSSEKHARMTDDKIEIISARTFFEALWHGSYDPR